jgi:methionyl aminopeptidase
MSASASATSTLVAHTLSPRRQVPGSIARPNYVGLARVPRYTGPNVQPPEIVDRMRVAGRLAAQALDEVEKAIAPGVTTDELDRVGHDFLVASGAYPSTLTYPGNGAPPYPKSLCTSVNEVICHGIPDSRPLQDGDIVNVDITAYLTIDGVGVHGDTNKTYLVGQVSDQDRLLVERTAEALRRAISAVRPGRRMNVIGRVIEAYAKRFDYGVVRDFTGHGVGPAFHTGLVVPHYDDERFDTLIEPGMTFTIEPMLTLGTIDWDLWDDGWTVTTKDKSRTAQFEHTLVVTDTGAEILTLA